MIMTTASKRNQIGMLLRVNEPLKVVWVFSVAFHAIRALKPRNHNACRVTELFEMLEFCASALLSKRTRFFLLRDGIMHGELWCECVLEPHEVDGVPALAFLTVFTLCAGVCAACGEEDPLWCTFDDPHRYDFAGVVNNVLCPCLVSDALDRIKIEGCQPLGCDYHVFLVRENHHPPNLDKTLEGNSFVASLSLGGLLGVRKVYPGAEHTF